VTRSPSSGCMQRHPCSLRPRWCATPISTRWLGSAGPTRKVLTGGPPGRTPVYSFLSGDSARHVEAFEFTVLASIAAQAVRVKVNGIVVGSCTINGSGSYVFQIPYGSVVSGKNMIDFEIPDARQPGNGDGRTLGISLAQWRLNTRAGR
jgi:hypothetical protein